MSGSLPTILADTAAATEDGTLTATGNVLANDSDNNGRTLTVASVNGTTVSGPTTITGTFQTLVIQPNGSYVYTLSNGSTPVRSLHNGQALPDVFTYVASDGQTYTKTVMQTVQNLIKQSEAFNDPSWIAFGTAPVCMACCNPATRCWSCGRADQQRRGAGRLCADDRDGGELQRPGHRPHRVGADGLGR